VWFLPRRGAGHAAARTVLSACAYNLRVDAPFKERMTGALIVVAAVILIVSEMFSGPEPKPASTTVLPAQSAEAGAPLRTYSMGLGDAPDAAVAVTSSPAPLPALTEPVPAPVVEAEPVSVPAAAVAEPPAPEKPKVTTAAASPAGKWWVQIGVYSSQDNAERLARKLRATGIDIDVVKLKSGGKDMFRLRAGPARDRAEAEALRARVAATGNDAKLVAP
jgi:cell division septation protein DedD